MASTFTANIQLEEPARGDQVGVWDTPVNNNMTIIDRVAGNISTISLNNSGVVLSAAQFQSATLIFNSTLTASVNITFPTSFVKSYNIFNNCSGSSAFTINMNSTAAGGQSISPPPGQTVQIFNDGTNLRFIGLPPVGTYWDYAGSSVPNWVGACTVPPWLNCDGTSISSATYPNLFNILGGTTLPDRRGVVGVTLNQGTNRVTSGISGLDGNSRFAVGGSQLLQAHQHTGTTGGQSADHDHAIPNVFLQGTGVSAGPTGPGFSGVVGAAQNTGGTSNDHSHNFTTNVGGSGNSQNIQPSTIYGICMIRSG